MLACLAASGLANPTVAPEPLWIEGTRATPQAVKLLDQLQAAEAYGLRASDYHLSLPPEELAAVLANRTGAAVRQRFATELSRAATRFAEDLHQGRIDARRAGFNLPAASAGFDTPRHVYEIATSRDVAASLAALEPGAPPYRRLKAALAQYRALAQQPGLTELPALPARSLFPGDEYAGAPQLRRLLEAVGDLPRAANSDEYAATTFDTALVAAIEHFQQRHGINVDGVVGPRTFVALTTPLAQRVAQIELAMERWRWLAAIERPSIVINIPQFMLYTVSHEAGPQMAGVEMRVIVGKTYPHMRTPVFSSRITQVVFQPYWDVPRGILLRELLPRIRTQRSLLDRYHMEIVSGQSDDARVVPVSAAAIQDLASGTLRLRQRPGPDNALGPVKFAMPNPYNVYLHATPEQALFERSARTFSHGCIRVADPAALAAYVLRDAPGEWNGSAIDAALSGTQTQRIRLERPVPVVVFYTTAVVTRSAEVLFFQDVYGHDAKLQQLLDRAAS